MLTPWTGSIYQPLNNSGGIEPGGTLTFYATGTETPKAVFQNAAGSVSHANPVVLDASGRALIFLNDDAAYDVIFKDAEGNEMWTIESVAAAAPAF